MACKNVFEAFDNITAFSSAVNSRSLNPVFAEVKKESSHNVSESGWAGTKTFEEAETLLNVGDGANLDKLTAVNMQSLPISNEQKSTLIKSVCGGVPLVPLAIMGVPKNMLATRKAPKVAKVVNIIYNISVSGSVSASEYIEAGAKVVSIVKALEARKVRVNLYITDVSKSNGQTTCLLVNVKKAAAPLNLLRLAYLAINPAFERRHVFRWMETCPQKLHKGFTSGYGYACNLTNYDRNHEAVAMINANIKNAIMLDCAEMSHTETKDVVKEYLSK